MSFNVQIRGAAELDLSAAQIWYESQRSGLGSEFNFEVSQIFARLTETPLIYPAVYQDVRRAVVHRFPYLIFGSWTKTQRFSHARTADKTPTKRSLASLHRRMKPS